MAAGTEAIKFQDNFSGSCFKLPIYPRLSLSPFLLLQQLPGTQKPGRGPQEPATEVDGRVGRAARALHPASQKSPKTR